jgi:glutathione S-transferase
MLRPMPARRRAPAARPRPRPRKDRLIQTRVPRYVEETLKREARRRRVTVSQLIRNLVEDAFQLVDGVVADVDQIVSDSVNLARSVGATARRIAGRRGAAPAPVPEEDFPHVDAWSEVVLQRPAPCARCGARLPRGGRAFAGLSASAGAALSASAGAARAWLCPACIGRLEEVSR